MLFGNFLPFVITAASGAGGLTRFLLAHLMQDYLDILLWSDALVQIHSGEPRDTAKMKSDATVKDPGKLRAVQELGGNYGLQVFRQLRDIYADGSRGLSYRK